MGKMNCLACKYTLDELDNFVWLKNFTLEDFCPCDMHRARFEECRNAWIKQPVYQNWYSREWFYED
jgi:hypothetical protein